MMIIFASARQRGQFPGQTDHCPRRNHRPDMRNRGHAHSIGHVACG